jgi:hypothetical protein
MYQKKNGNPIARKASSAGCGNIRDRTGLAIHPGEREEKEPGRKKNRSERI